MELSITKLSKPSPSFDVFQNTVFESLDTEKKECFEICEVYEVNNSCLQHKFDQLQKCWQAEWRDKEDCTNVCYGYLDVSAESEEAVMAACRHGLGCGNIEKSVLGDPHKAVQLSRHADVVQYKYRNNYQRTLLMFKLMKGKVEHLPSKKQKVTNSSIVAQSEPASKFNTLIDLTSYSADQSYEMFYLSKLWYIRHYNEDSQLSAKPPQVCPVALVEVRCGVTQSYNTEGFSIQRLLSTYPEAHKPIAQVNLTKDQELLSPHTEICPIFENIERLKDEDKIVVADLVKTPNESMVNLAGGGLNKSIDKLAEKAAKKVEDEDSDKGKNLKSKTDTEYIEATDENTAKVDRGYVKNGDESMDTLANAEISTKEKVVNTLIQSRVTGGPREVLSALSQNTQHTIQPAELTQQNLPPPRRTDKPKKMKKRNFGRRSKLKKVDIDSVLKRIKNASKVLPNSDTKEMSYATTALTTDTSKMIQSHNASHSNHYPEISSTGKHIVSKTVQLGKAVIDNKKGSTESLLTTETSLKLTQTQATVPVPENQCDSFTKVKKRKRLGNGEPCKGGLLSQHCSQPNFKSQSGGIESKNPIALKSTNKVGGSKATPAVKVTPSSPTSSVVICDGLSTQPTVNPRTRKLSLKKSTANPQDNYNNSIIKSESVIQVTLAHVKDSTKERNSPQRSFTGQDTCEITCKASKDVNSLSSTSDKNVLPMLEAQVLLITGENCDNNASVSNYKHQEEENPAAKGHFAKPTPKNKVTPSDSNLVSSKELLAKSRTSGASTGSDSVNSSSSDKKITQNGHVDTVSSQAAHSSVIPSRTNKASSQTAKSSDNKLNLVKYSNILSDKSNKPTLKITSNSNSKKIQNNLSSLTHLKAEALISTDDATDGGHDDRSDPVDGHQQPTDKTTQHLTYDKGSQFVQPRNTGFSVMKSLVIKGKTSKRFNPYERFDSKTIDNIDQVVNGLKRPCSMKDGTAKLYRNHSTCTSINNNQRPPLPKYPLLRFKDFTGLKRLSTQQYRDRARADALEYNREKENK